MWDNGSLLDSDSRGGGSTPPILTNMKKECEVCKACIRKSEINLVRINCLLAREIACPRWRENEVHIEPSIFAHAYTWSVKWDKDPIIVTVA